MEKITAEYNRKQGQFRTKLTESKSVEVPDDKYKGPIKIPLGEVFIALEEAKKEFPIYETAKMLYLQRVGKTEISSGLDVAGIHTILGSLREEWFVKWFGE
jgi:hypothetical protein